MGKRKTCSMEGWLEECGRNQCDCLSMSDMKQIRIEKPALLLHSCCGPCSTAVLENVLREFSVTVFFYNPNITDDVEYARRKEAQLQFIEQYNESPEAVDRIAFLEGPIGAEIGICRIMEPKLYFGRDKELFYQRIKGLEEEPEGGRRCVECFRLRLEKTAEVAKLSGYDWFGTTLTVSPHKNCEVIREIGQNIAMCYGLTFLDRDFKKKGGFQRSIELSRKYGLYRQNYCGCEFSDWRRQEKPEK